MPKSTNRTRRSELRARLVEMVRAGRNPEELATKFEPTAQAIRKWVPQADLDAGRRQDGLTTEERDELRRLRRENKVLREGLRLHAHPDSPWEYKPEEIRIAYRVVAADAPLREDVLHFRVESELLRVKEGLGLP